MALIIKNRVKETTTTTGTSSFTLAGAVSGYQAFSSIGNGSTTYYACADQTGTNWEVGIGTYTSSGNTLSRDTILSSSNSGNKVTFGSGSKDIFVTYPAERALYADASNNISLSGAFSGTGAFTTLSASSTVSGTGFSTYLASPPAIGGTAPAAVTGTAITAADQTSFKETTSVLPTIMPTLNLDFVNSKTVDPRITFTRATTATYYDGVTTAMAEENLLTYSQDFSNAVWVASNITVGAVTTAPNGTSTAYPLTATAGNGTLLQTFTATANAYTFSIYIQRVTGTGNIDITVDGVTYATQTTTGTWTRFTVTTTPAAGSKTAGIRLATSGDVVNIWCAQLEQRSSVTAYTATTTAPITNYIPVLMTAASGAPRLDYDPVTRQPKGLLIEEQRTNLLTYSEQFDNAAWTGSNASITTNATVAPNGTLTADKLIALTTNAEHAKGLGVVVVSGTVYTFTCFMKAGEEVNGVLWQNVNGGTVFNLNNGTIISGSGTIVPVGNGWYRCSILYTPTSTSGLIRIYGKQASPYIGDGYSGIYIWGAQLEAGAFATSYIPTVASQVTRNADQASMTGTNFNSWYNQGQGTIDVEMYDSNGTGARAFTISDNTANNVVYIANNSAGVTASGSVRASFSNTFNSGKSALSSVSASYGQSVNGGAVSTSTTSGNMPAVSQLQLGASTVGNYLNGHIRNVKNYPVAQSNAILQGLTS